MKLVNTHRIKLVSIFTLVFVFLMLMALLSFNVYAQTATSTPTPTLTPTPTTTATVTPTTVETLLDAGISYPTIFGVGFAIILITLALAIAL